ncbi:MAG TPA: alpha/beta hydrolase family protein [Saprospiraceae bacterium]|nr:alpha/beta hydrolase family protein [Saprospiraceae bacterium]HNT21541.1 alpha/beta hydrolase family protein [Saprospiraceae bacterium]
MKNKRRDFIKYSGLAGMGLGLKGWRDLESFDRLNAVYPGFNEWQNESLSIIGQYGPWAAKRMEGKRPSFSFRNPEWTDPEAWRKSARQRLKERMAIPELGSTPRVTVHKQYVYDGLYIEELSWPLPYGRPTEAVLLKPANAKGPLPGILAFHDHGGNKYFGTRKITKTSDQQHPLMVSHQRDYYSGFAWANEIAKKGYTVLVPDAFVFGSRRVMMHDVPVSQRRGLSDEDPENPEKIKAYNEWAGQHEHILAKSLFCAGTTWPGVFFAEDRVALDVLAARSDVDANRLGCGGLSGGGLRTVFMAGLDERIRCAVCVGFMSTWKDFLLNKSYTHTWMTYVPLLPNELEFPEILGLRAPLPTLVLNDVDDALYTMDEMKKAEQILKEVYGKAEAARQFECSYYPGPHKFDAAMQKEAFVWFDKHLKS